MGLLIPLNSEGETSHSPIPGVPACRRDVQGNFSRSGFLLPWMGTW